MSSLADQVIAALHAGSDQLVPVVEGLTPDQVTGASATAQWDVSTVLGHLGSGAVIALAGLDASVAGTPNPGMEFNRSVWATWDAMAPGERVASFLTANAALLARYDSFDEQTRATQQVDLGFLPAPVDLATAARFRLNEFALHSWDVRVALDPAAVLQPDAVPLLLGGLPFMLGWLAKPAPLGGRTVRLRVDLAEPGSSFGLTLGDEPSMTAVPADAPDGILTLPAEAWLRLVTGRLAPTYTPDGVTVTGEVSLDTLRAVFPGF